MISPRFNASQVMFHYNVEDKEYGFFSQEAYNVEKEYATFRKRNAIECDDGDDFYDNDGTSKFYVSADERKFVQVTSVRVTDERNDLDDVFGDEHYVGSVIPYACIKEYDYYIYSPEQREEMLDRFWDCNMRREKPLTYEKYGV
jgi:hypothetical protein